MGFAENLAKQKKKVTSNNVYYEELESAALHGLVDAATKYDPKRGPFEVYARSRINGEMEDYLRALGTNWGVRSVDSALVIEENKPEYDTSHVIEAVMRLLPEKGQKMFRMYYLERMTMKDIGERLGISESMVSWQIRQYRNLLQKQKDRIIDLAAQISECS
jgi:RNA polymerase sigma factor (sigma-70 family)